ncbi:MAG TPA: hypothetical protein VH143_34785 [Kofleriaceae bacterium]|jgi:hypothetical protein|nr:hypothetical protein [Kofleriaceae bacterium]
MSDIYRDPTEGAAAKRQDLLRRRRDDLATMPHAIRRVVVARDARVAAGLAMTIGGVAMLATALRPALAARLDSMLPGVQPASISTMLFGAWLLALLAYMVSRARSEHRFAVAMSRYVLPGRDLDYDLQRLDHERPDEMARDMAHRREVASVAWLVLGASLAVPATLLYAASGIHADGWPIMREFEAALVDHAHALALYGAIGLVGALVMTTRAARVSRVAVIDFAATAAIVVLSRITALPIALAVVPLVMGVLVRRLRRERLAITALDPAAGSELFSLRDTLRATWRGLCAVGRVAGKPSTLRAVIAIAVVAGVFVGGSQALRRKKMGPPTAQPQIAVEPSAPAHSASFDKLPYPNPGAVYGFPSPGVFTIDTQLDAHGSITVSDLANLGTLPPHWLASIEVSSASGPVDVALLRGDFVEIGASSHTFEVGCVEDGENIEIGLRIRNRGDMPQAVKLTLKPTLTTCEPHVE